MSKRLIILLALAFVVGIAAAAYAEVQNVKVSGDLTVYGIMRSLDIQHGNDENDKDQSMASITRVRIDADLTDNVSSTVRLLNERYWGEETVNSTGNDSNTDISLDLAYVTLKEFLYSPATLTVGRQELHFGNDMIVGDPDTNNNVGTASAFDGTGDDADLSARKAFDAIRLTLNYDPLVVDIVAAKVDENTRNLEDDTDLYGINANYALNKTTLLEGYLFTKYQQRNQFTSDTMANKPNTVHTVGGRMVTTAIKNLAAQLEVAYQFGKHNPSSGTEAGANYSFDDGDHVVRRKAWALEAGLTYDMPKVKYTPSLSAGYAYFSGNDYNYNTRQGAYRAWDPMYENQKFGDIANALFNQTNIHVLALAAKAKPMDDITLKGEYFAFWWAKRYPENQDITTVRGNAANATNKQFAAHEIDLTATYDYTEDVQLSLLTGVLIPGSAFKSGSRDTATEVIGSMKVTF